VSAATAEMIWIIVGGYAAIGVLVALVMIFGLIKRIDPLAHAAPWRVKLLLSPGFVALWPLAVLLALTRKPAPAP